MRQAEIRKVFLELLELESKPFTWRSYKKYEWIDSGTLKRKMKYRWDHFRTPPRPCSTSEHIIPVSVLHLRKKGFFLAFWNKPPEIPLPRMLIHEIAHHNATMDPTIINFFQDVK